MGDVHRRGSLVWPILVITAGVLLLLNNLGILSLDLWELLLRGWPIILIAAGIDLLLGRRSLWASLAAAVLIIAVVSLGISLYAGWIGSGSPPSQPVERALGGASSATIQIDTPLADLSLGPGAGEEFLIEGGILPVSGTRLEQEYALAQGKATLRLEQEFTTPVIFGRTPDWDLQLAAGVPLQLEVNSGVGRTVVDLRRLRVDSLKVELGAGLVSLWLPEAGRMTVEVGLGVGQTLIRVPRGIGVRIAVDRGLVGLDLPRDFSEGTAGYNSPGFATAAERVELKVNQGVGLISLHYED